MSERFSERNRRSVETGAHLGQLSRSKVDPLLLYIRALLLAVCAIANHLELGRHRLDRSREFSQLASDDRVSCS